jgi:NADP-dependent 3-hydroxy acid dehydrogenase YdfG
MAQQTNITNQAKVALVTGASGGIGAAPSGTPGA